MPLFCEMTSTAPLFTAPQLKTLLKKRGEAPLYCAIDLAEEFGAEEVLAFHSITESHSMRTHLNRVARNLDDNDQQTIAKKLAVVQHYDGMVQARKDSGVDRDSEDWNKLSFAVSIEMQEAGISPQQAWEGVSQNMTVQQILAVRDHAVELSVSSGWL
jgi:microsomal dipeptidase-like Zn-dependent dipeptidase